MSDLNEGAESLDALADETLDAAAPVTDAAIAESSPADGEKDTLLDVVRDVTGKREPSASPAGERDTSGKGAAGGASETQDRDDENFSDVPFSRHPRFRELVASRNELKEPAERYRKLTQFMTDNALDGEEVARAINLAALLKRDPQKAWDELKPIMQGLARSVGVVLPDDLRAMVQSNQLSADAAKLVAKERAAAEALRGQRTFDEQVAERRQRADAQAAAAAAQQARLGAVRSWEQAKRDSDPDFDRKAEDIEIEVLRLQRREGQPKTAEDVRKQLDAALKAVNARHAAAAPRRPDITPVTGGRTGGSPRPEPESLLDVIRSNRRAG